MPLRSEPLPQSDHRRWPLHDHLTLLPTRDLRMPRNLPGFYFDDEKQRYFPISSNTSTSKPIVKLANPPDNTVHPKPSPSSRQNLKRKWDSTSSNMDNMRRSINLAQNQQFMQFAPFFYRRWQSTEDVSQSNNMLENSIYIPNDQSSVTISYSLICDIFQGKRYFPRIPSWQETIDSSREWSHQDVLRRYERMVILIQWTSRHRWAYYITRRFSDGILGTWIEPGFGGTMIQYSKVYASGFF